MNRRQFMLVLDRLSRVLTLESEVVVIGSQAVHAWLDDVPEEVARSREVDVAALADEDNAKAMRVNWVMGELSPFDEEHDVYAEGVSIDLFVGSTGWLQRARSVDIVRSDDSVLRVLCPDLHDLCVAKLVAARRQDEDFVTSLAGTGTIDLDRLTHLLVGTDADESKLRRAAETLDRVRRSPGVDNR